MPQDGDISSAVKRKKTSWWSDVQRMASSFRLMRAAIIQLEVTDSTVRSVMYIAVRHKF